MRRAPKYVHGFIRRHGKPRFYFRRRGFNKVPLPGHTLKGPSQTQVIGLELGCRERGSEWRAKQDSRKATGTRSRTAKSTTIVPVR